MADHDSGGDTSRPAEDWNPENESSIYASIVQTDEDASSIRETFQRPRPGRGYGTTRSYPSDPNSSSFQLAKARRYDF
jgi:Ca2+:H+ antiporter